MPPYFRLSDVTQPKLNMQNQIIKGFKEEFCCRFLESFNSSDMQSFPPKINQLYENNYLYETNFNFYKTSLNIQNGGTYSTNVKIFNCL